jgi:hydrogenase maturation protein HypF
MVDGGGIDGPEATGCPSAPASFAAVRMCLLGRVQGVGFRPFVVRLATGLGLAGWVRNTPDGVVIHLEGPVDRLAAFRERVVREIPPAAEIHAITVEEEQEKGCVGFSIRPSERVKDAAGAGAIPHVRVVITPDLAVCPACLAEFDSVDDRRHGFALSGCTDCGPRFSFQTSAPFDRERTTMVDFPPCPECLREYTDPSDRRFHAQNIACPRCGPRIRLEMRSDSGAMPLSGYPSANSASANAVIASRWPFSSWMWGRSQATPRSMKRPERPFSAPTRRLCCSGAGPARRWPMTSHPGSRQWELFSPTRRSIGPWCGW